LITGTNATLLSLNGSGITFPSLTVNGIVNDINVELGAGNDNFRFLGNANNPNGQSSVAANLIIDNDDGSNVTRFKIRW